MYYRDHATMPDAISPPLLAYPRITNLIMSGITPVVKKKLRFIKFHVTAVMPCWLPTNKICFLIILDKNGHDLNRSCP